MRRQIRSLATGAALVVIVVGIVVSGITLSQPKSVSAAVLNEMQKRVLANWLARHPTYGYVNSGAYSCPHSTGSPFAIRDFNDDGHQDFAVILRVRGGPSHLVVFNGPLVNDAQEPAYEADNDNLGFFAAEPGLYVEVCILGPDASPGFSLVPRGSTYEQEWTPAGGA